jgi:hypothetical protein
MKYIKKIFGEINLSWPKLIIMAIVIGIYCGVVAMLPITADTSFHDIAETFEVWIFFGIFIIMNSKSNKDAALKCFIFFLISQPLVYLVQVPFSILGWQLFIYYKYWFIWTILTIPMGFIGYYMKKDKWWTVIILAPMLLFLAYHYMGFLGQTLYWFPRHLLTTIYCIAALFIFPLILENKTARLIAYIISGLVFIVTTSISLFNPYVYETSLGSSGGTRFEYFDNTYKAYFEDKNIGDVKIEYNEHIDDYLLTVKLKHGGKTKLIIESPDKKKKIYKVDVRYRKYTIEEIKEGK